MTVGRAQTLTKRDAENWCAVVCLWFCWHRQRCTPSLYLTRCGQRGFEAKIFGLGLVDSATTSSLSSCNAGLVLTKVVLVASLSVIEITSFALRSSLIGNCCLLYNILLELTFEWYIDTVVSDCHTRCDFLALINFMLERKRSYTVFL